MPSPSLGSGLHMEPPALSGLRWRINRLRCMSLAEIGHRLQRMVAIRWEQWVDPAARPAPAPTPTLRVPAFIVPPRGLDVAPYAQAAERLVAGRFDVFALHDVFLGTPPRWNRDPKTGTEAPLAFGKRLDYRDPGLVGDIKYLWEPNRHLHLVTLAQAHLLTGNRRYREAIAQHLSSWFSACPAGRGANWSSALELGIRLISWSLTWQLLGGWTSPLFHGRQGKLLRRQWLDSIYHHGEYICSHFSLYSSANNHLIGEAAGLFIAALTWPCWPAAQHWRQEAMAILERETQLQNAPDGVNREQAVAYQEFELNLLLLPLLAARANGFDFSPAYGATLERMLEYLASLMDRGGHLPMFGDADDGAAFRLDPALAPDFRACRSLLNTGAILFQRGDFKAKAGPLDEQTRWLLPEAAERHAALPLPASEVASLPLHRVFPEGGVYLLGDGYGTPREIHLVADAGPLGYGGIAAHGHADALSFTLSLGGLEFLVDPGTYAYHTEGEWRAYFRGTSAHNTVRIDGQDQSRQGGNFLWLAKAAASGRRWVDEDGGQIFEGWHDGYTRLADPVRHSRCIRFDPVRRQIVIEDRLEMAAPHRVELFFHFSEHCRVEQCGADFVVTQGDQHLRLALPQHPDATLALHQGSLEPRAGWISRHFDQRQPAPTLHWQAEVEESIVLRSVIHCAAPAEGKAEAADAFRPTSASPLPILPD